MHRDRPDQARPGQKLEHAGAVQLACKDSPHSFAVCTDADDTLCVHIEKNKPETS